MSSDLTFFRNMLPNGFIIFYVFCFISNTSISNPRLKLTKKQTNTKQHPEAEFYCLNIILILHQRYQSNKYRTYGLQKCYKRLITKSWEKNTLHFSSYHNLQLIPRTFLLKNPGVVLSCQRIHCNHALF